MQPDQAALNTLSATTTAQIQNPRVRRIVQTMARIVLPFWLLIVWLSFLANIPRISQSLISDSNAREVFSRLKLPIELYGTLFVVPLFISLICFSLVALLILWHRPDDWTAVLTAVALVAVPSATGQPVSTVNSVVFNLSLFWLLCIFPDGRFRPRWAKWTIIPFTFLEVAVLAGDSFIPDSSYGVLSILVFSCYFGAAGFQVYRYRHTQDTIQRKQINLLAFGALFVVGLGLLNVALIGIDQISLSPAASLVLNGLISYLAILRLTFIPLALAFGIFRLGLWRISLTLNRGLVYGGLAIGLALIFAIVFGLLQAVLQALLGPHYIGLAAAVAAGIVVAAFNPARKRLQLFVDRRIFKLRIGLQQAAELNRAEKAAPRLPGSDEFIGQTIGPYRISRALGQGGMGKVYLGEGSGHCEPVAIKILPPQLVSESTFRARFEREARLLQGLNHPNIIRLHDYGQAGNLYFMAMDYINGSDLEKMLAERGHLSFEVAAGLISKLAEALDYAHTRGLVHRDIKPSNVMVKTKADVPEPILMDFGLARLVSSKSGLTQSGVVMGTLAYISPEQIRATETIDHRADIYSFGVMCYELLTGSLPFKGNEIGQLIFAHLEKPPPDPRTFVSDLPPGVAYTLLWPLEKSPDNRPQTAGEFASRLASAVVPVDLPPLEVV